MLDFFSGSSSVARAPDDKTATRFAGRCADRSVGSPAEPWQGVSVIDEK